MRSTRLKSLNVCMVSLCRHAALAIWSCVPLVTCAGGLGWEGPLNTALLLMQAYVAADVTG